MKKPNIIYILADDMGYGDISYYNENLPFETPHFDQMCKEGMRFTDAHSSSAVCTPSRYSIMTGRYNWRSALKKGIIVGYDPALIEEDCPTVAAMLKEAGYHTAAIGKWHLGMNMQKAEVQSDEPLEFKALYHVDFTKKLEQTPIHRGFDYFYGIAGSLDMPPYVYVENDHFIEQPTHKTVNTGKQFWRNGLTGETFVHENVLDELTDKVLEKIEEYQQQENPFFIYFPMPAPHTPILPRAEFQGKSGTNEYGDFVLHCDDVLRRVVEKLEETGLSEDTILVFTSDNGCSENVDFAELAQFGYNPSYIFKGCKASIYEGGHRIPLMVKWPSKIAGDSVCPQTVCLTDFMATMAEVAGCALKENMAVDSVSNLSLWKGAVDVPVRQDTIHQSSDGSLALRHGKWKLEMCPGNGITRYKPELVEDVSGLPRFQLYDLENDIGETTNLYEQEPEVFEALKKRLVGYVLNGRSTPGAKQKNTGADIWQAVQWMTEVE